MSTPILQTKLYIPYFESHELIARPRLSEQLSRGMNRKLTLVAAPAGFGKTALVCKWLQERKPPTAWLSLDEQDNDLLLFLRYLVAALQQVDPQVGRLLAQNLAEMQTVAVEPILVELINEIDEVTTAATGKIVLVLDDYHVIQDERIHTAMVYLVEHLPRQLHIILTTRLDPPLPLPRLRVRQQLNEIRIKDLRFRAEELQAFFSNVMQIELAPDVIAMLAGKTEGWVAGVQMAGLSLQGQDQMQTERFLADLTGTDRYIADYLVEEVLDRQPPAERAFLLKTSILERLSPALCDAVTREQNGREMLGRLEVGNFFLLPLDTERRWYRYHHLFVELLRAHLQIQQPDFPNELHQRACDWFVEQGWIDEALHHAFAGEDHARAVQLIERNASAIYLQGNVHAPLAWLQRLPHALVMQRPKLSIAHAWILLLATEPEELPPFLHAVQPLIEHGENDLARYLKLQCDLLRIHIHLQQGELARCIEEGERVLQVLSLRDQPSQAKHFGPQISAQEETLLRGCALYKLAGACTLHGAIPKAHGLMARAVALSQVSNSLTLTMLAGSSLARIEVTQGHLRMAEQTCHRLLDWATEKGWQNSPVTSYMFTILGEIYREWNQFEQAERYLKDGERLAKLSDIARVRDEAAFLLVRLRMGQAEWQQATEILNRIVSTSPPDYHPVAVYSDALQVRLWIATGATDRAAAWARTVNPSIMEQPDDLQAQEYLTLCRVALAQGCPQDAYPLLETLRMQAVADGRLTRLIEVLILLALTLDTQEGRESEVNRQALAYLGEALRLAKPERYVRRFVDEGEPMAYLLRQAAAQGIEPAYVTSLLRVFQAEMPTANDTQPLPDPLTERELEVLRLVADGFSNQQISKQLVVSIATTKKHMSNILSKLSAKNRTEATRRAQDLGLI